MEKLSYTLIFIRDTDKVLFGHKKRGIGRNTWNGYGGKVEQNEDIYTCAIRELQEESNLKVNRKDLNYMGAITYVTSTTNEKRVVHVFNCTTITGEPRETEEMIPKWFHYTNIPYKEMLPDMEFWLPLVLQDKWIDAQFIYKDNGMILDYKVIQLIQQPII